MKKKFLTIVCLLLCFSTLFASCKKNNVDNVTSQTGLQPVIEHLIEVPYNAPETLMTVEQYRSEVQNLLKGENFTTATDEYLNNVDNLGDSLRDSIIYSKTDTKECTGTKYYISNNGNDTNDGTSPETAWATLRKLKTVQLKAGDLVLLERGSTWRESLRCTNGVTYSAYGEGHKPRLSNSVDGLQEEWVKTKTSNVWMYSGNIKYIGDVGIVVYDNGESYGEQRKKISELKSQGDFVYLGPASEEPAKKQDYCLYIYSVKNPSEQYRQIDISKGGSVLDILDGAKNITVNNLELLYGQDYYFANNPENIVVSDCVFRWQGGQTNQNGTRYGGGGGAWMTCDNLVFDHCYFYQQFDCAMTSQFNGAYNGNRVSIFNKFTVKNCLIEKCDYGFEYFSTQTNTDDNKITNMYFGYNFFRDMGKGFGDKHQWSTCILSWYHENTTYDSLFEYNVFFRPSGRALEITGKKQVNGEATHDNSLLPTMRNNIYICVKNKSFAKINDVGYNFSESSYNRLKDAGIETGALYVFTKK